MAIDFDFGENVLDFPLRVDDESGADNPHGDFSVQLLLLPDALGLEGLMRRVARQREIQPVLVTEFLELLDAVAAHPQDFRV